MFVVGTLQDTDAELLGRSSRDSGALGAFYERYEGEILRFFYRATRRADIAADLTAEVFAAALDSCDRFDPSLANARS